MGFMGYVRENKITMKVQIEDFETGWYGLSLGVKKEDIKALIKAFKQLEENQNHFHLRNNMEGNSGVADIEIFFQEDSEENNMDLDISNPTFTKQKH